jgi:hypothetical protein
MVSKIPSLIPSINSFKFLNQKLIKPLEDRIRIFVENPPIEAISAQYLAIRSQNIPRLKRVNSLRWLQFYTIDPPLM